MKRIIVTKKHLITFVLLLALAGFAPLNAQAVSKDDKNLNKRPPLFIILVVDQLRSEQLDKCRPYLLPARDSKGKTGGFNRLLDLGSYHKMCRYNIQPTYTAVGHAAIITGAAPCYNGIIGNYWYDKELGKVGPVNDDNYPLVGTGKPAGSKLKGYSPKRLAASTIGDELKLATNGLAKVYSVSLKDRASIILGGHSADLAIWYDYATGKWVSSTWYLPQGKLPMWVEKLNNENWIDKQFGWTWNKLLPESAYRFSAPDGQMIPSNAEYLGAKFPHVMDGRQKEPNQAFRECLATSPLGTTITLKAAGDMIGELSLGADDVPDLLTINLASYDRIGHTFGANSPQLQDAFLRLDRDLADFLTTVDKKVGLDNTVIAVTGDHGCAPTYTYAKGFKLNAGIYSNDAVVENIQKALTEHFGKKAPYVLAFNNPHIYLNHEVIPEDKFQEAVNLAGEIARNEPCMFAVYTREQILSGKLPQTELAKNVSRSYHAQRGGDLFIVSKPFWIATKKNADGGWHATPWSFDTQVPLIMSGAKIKKGVRYNPCNPQDISATFCTLMEITLPSACTGRVLTEDL